MQNNLEEYCLEALLKAKKKNLTQQAELKAASAELDKEIASRPEVQEHIQTLSNTGGSARVPLNNLIPFDLRVQYKVTKSWDQEFLSKCVADGYKIPFKVQYAEDTKAVKVCKEDDPDLWDYVEKGLQTKINERPYVQFIDPLKGENNE
jgi:hypothetical protein|tara:strand:+ start:298 stop:744 length:447 start_codon:yes stop_codon:yes gene_type:complete